MEMFEDLLETVKQQVSEDTIKLISGPSDVSPSELNEIDLYEQSINFKFLTRR